MDYFSADGIWWLPETPSHRIPGTLTFDADGLSLVLYSALIAKSGAVDGIIMNEDSDWGTIPVIQGHTNDGYNVTVMEASGIAYTGTDVIRNTYRAKAALVGVHTSRASFIEAQVQFDCLTPWTQPPPITESAGGLGVHTLRFDERELARAKLNGAELSLTARVVGTIAANKVSCEQEVVLSLKFKPTPISGVVNEWIRPLQDFLIFALGRPVRLTVFYLLPVDTNPTSTYAKVSFEAVQPAAGPPVDTNAIVAYSAPTLFIFRDCPIPFAKLMPRWFSLRDELLSVLVLLHAPYYVGFMFSEHRYSSILEVLKRLLACEVFQVERGRVQSTGIG